MSKLGKKPIQIPKDTKVKVESGKLILTGPKGSKELSINDKIFSTSFILPQARNKLSPISAEQTFIISFSDSSLKNLPTGPLPEIFSFFSIVK